MVEIKKAFTFTFRTIGFDRTIGFATLTNIAPIIFGPVTALLIATRFSPELQGYYYAFGSITALQFVFELGLGQTIIQFASHEWSKLSLETNGRILGETGSLSRLISLGRMSFKWYSLSAGLLLLGVSPTGYFFFSRTPTFGIEWAWPWLVLCLGISLNFVLLPAYYLLQGCNQVASYWLYRFIQQIVNGLSLWLAISTGARLWSGPIAVASGFAWSVLFLWWYYRAFFTSFLSIPSGHRVKWREEVWPVQSRIAISWLSAYFTTSVFAPLLFKFVGPIVAGQMGMTVTLTNLLLAISSSWVVTRAPRFGVLIAQRKYKQLDGLFLKSLLMSFVVVCFGAIGMWAMVHLAYIYQHPLGSRILPPLPVGLFLLAAGFNSVTTSLSIYLRAHKKEPLVGIYLVSSALIVTLTIVFGRRFGAIGVTAAYLGVVALFQFPATLLVFWFRRSEWRKEHITTQIVGIEHMERVV